MARQYDVEDLLNSDASDPDGEPTPIATNDDVRDGKIIVETADGTGKIGDVSQIVADYLKKSAGFYTESTSLLHRPSSNESTVDGYVAHCLYTASMTADFRTL